MRVVTTVGHRPVKRRVKAVHRGTIVLTNGVASLQAGIPKVDLAHSLLFLLGVSAAGNIGPFNTAMVRIDFTAATSLAAVRANGAESDALTVGFLVIEYWPGVLRSVQRGTITGTATATIASVDMVVAALTALGFSSTNASGIDAFGFPRLALNSGIQVGSTVGGFPTVRSGYQVFSE